VEGLAAVIVLGYCWPDYVKGIQCLYSSDGLPNIVLVMVVVVVAVVVAIIAVVCSDGSSGSGSISSSSSSFEAGGSIETSGIGVSQFSFFFTEL